MTNLIKLILIMLIGSCSAEVYNWNVRALEHFAKSDTDFGNELKLQSELSNELQRDLLKISGKANENTDNTKLGKLYDDLHKDSVEELQQQEDNSYGMKEQKNVNDYSVNLGMSNEKISNFETTTKFSDGSDKQFIKIEQNKEQFNLGNEQNVNNYQSYEGANDYRKTKYNSHQMDSLYSKYNSDYHQASELNIKPINGGHRQPQVQQYRYPNPIIQKTLTSYDDHSQTKYEHNTAKNEKYEEAYLNGRQKNNAQSLTINDESQENYQLPQHFSEKESTDIRNFLGSNLFKHTARKCFTGDDIILLTLRKDFENLMPKDLLKCPLNDRMVAVLMNYFYVCHRLISSLAVGETKLLVLKSFFDTLGGYLNFYLVPVAKYSYYAGQLSLETTYNILRLHRQCKSYLNTNGNGWKPPMKDVLNELNDISIEPLQFDEYQNNNEPSYCMHLDIDTDHTGSKDYKNMIVSLPQLEVTDDGAGQLGNIWLPFRRKRVYDLKSRNSAYIVVKFYETVTKCYLYENVNQDCYNRKFNEWLLQNIQTHLSDDVLYPGLGAVLRVSEFLKRGRTIARNYNNLWQIDYDTGESREKKSYQTNDKQKSNKYMVMPKNFKRKQKDWDKDESFFRNTGQNPNSLKKVTVNLEKYKSLNDGDSLDRKHRQYISSDQLKLAAAVLEEQSKANHTTTQFRVLEMTPIQWIFVIIPLVVVIVIGIICCLKQRKKKKKSRVSLKEPGGGKRKGKKSEEETLLLNANSKSVVHGKYSTSKHNRFKPPPHMRSISSSTAGSTGSSSSSLMCQLPAKCFAFKRSGPAIIETTSLDYSSSDAEDKAIKKAHLKAVKIDEKSGKNKGKENSTASNNDVPANGKEKKIKEIPKK